MKYCRICGNQLPDDSLFCNICGSPQENTGQFGGMQYQQVPQEKPVKKSRKKPVLIISIITLLVAAAVAVFFFLILPKLGNKAYFVVHGEKYYFTAEEGVKDLQNAENGFEWDERNGRQSSFRKVLADGTVITDETEDTKTAEDGSGVRLGPLGSPAGFIIRVTGSEYHTNDVSLHGFVFTVKNQNEDALPQFSLEENNLFSYSRGHTSPDVKYEVAYVADGKIISTDFADEDYEKLLKSWNKYGNNQALSQAMYDAKENGGFYLDPLFDWCTDKDYLCFLRINGQSADDKNRDWELDLKNKDEYRMILTRCKLMGMVKSGEIQSFAEIMPVRGPDNAVQISIYANDTNLKKILNNYKLPADWWEKSFEH